MSSWKIHEYTVYDRNYYYFKNNKKIISTYVINFNIICTNIEQKKNLMQHSYSFPTTTSGSWVPKITRGKRLTSIQEFKSVRSSLSLCFSCFNFPPCAYTHRHEIFPPKIRDTYCTPSVTHQTFVSDKTSREQFRLIYRSSGKRGLTGCN